VVHERIEKRSRQDDKSLAFTPDGRTLISAGGDVKVWDVNTGRERLTLKGDTSSGRATYLVGQN
jgi:WD40 repeat protein